MSARFAILLGFGACFTSAPAVAQEYYWCESQHGYYPYVQSCPEQWRKVVAPPQTYQAPVQQPAPLQRTVPVAPQPAASDSNAFQQGLADRGSWETWFAGSQGDYHDGAFYWSGQRSLPQPGSCANAAMSRDWQAGCAEAQKRLAISDARRRSEPDYKRGWNSWSAQASIQFPASPDAPAAPIPAVVGPQKPVPLAPAATPATVSIADVQTATGTTDAWVSAGFDQIDPRAVTALGMCVVSHAKLVDYYVAAARRATVRSAPEAVALSMAQADCVDANNRFQEACQVIQGDMACLRLSEAFTIRIMNKYTRVAPLLDDELADIHFVPPAQLAAESTPTQPQPPLSAPAIRAALPSPQPELSGRGIENAFIDIVAKGKATYEAGSTDFQKGAARPARKAEICRLMQDKRVAGWTGKIAKISTNGDGKGVVYIEIAPNVRIETYNNSLSDFRFKTLIEPGTELFQSLFSLMPDELVEFSGTFLEAEADCIKESSLSIAGSMTDPEFIFRFSEIKPSNQ